jgi:hypothetical protein
MPIIDLLCSALKLSFKAKIGWRGELINSIRTSRHLSVAARRSQKKRMLLNLGDLVLDTDKTKATELGAREYRELQF